jgi:hypothetical protein
MRRVIVATICRRLHVTAPSVDTSLPRLAWAVRLAQVCLTSGEFSLVSLSADDVSAKPQDTFHYSLVLLYILSQVLMTELCLTTLVPIFANIP